MPFYSYECPDCGGIEDAYRKMEDRNNAPDCELCKVNMRKIISAYSAHGDLEPYFDENLETGIKSKKHREKVMKEQGVAEKVGKGWH